MLLEHGLVPPGKTVVILQPRRLAARLLAVRVAEERRVALGDEVGYQIRFENRTGSGTRVIYVTEGILLRRLVSDPALADIAVLVFDEFHERHLFGDITLARALQLQQTLRPDLTLIVMSATLDGAAVQKYLDPCALLQAEGRMFPVRLEYLPKPVDMDRTPAWATAAPARASATDWFAPLPPAKRR
jgi:ATP-dependent helicase HrpB